MSIVVPIENNASKCIEYIFENAEKLPNDFYVESMNLIKQYHDYGNNFYEIHAFLELNKNKIDNLILEEIKKYIIHPITYPVPKEKCSINCDCSCPLFECSRVCCSCFTMWFGVLFLLGFLAVIAWCFATKK